MHSLLHAELTNPQLRNYYANNNVFLLPGKPTLIRMGAKLASVVGVACMLLLKPLWLAVK
jgi:hypothetical protein